MKASGLPSFYSETAWVCSRCQRRSSRRAYRSALLPAGQFFCRDSGLPNQANLSDARRHRFRQFGTSKPNAAPKRVSKLPDGHARTRFAPSPTGFLHIGGLRTALFSYLLAKRTEGQFILRIEDTDQRRLVAGAEERLYEDLTWAGLSWDEGPNVSGPYGPYKQSLRNEIYRKHASEVLQAGQAYRCFCTPQTAGEAKAAYVTSGCYQNCSSLSQEESEEKASNSANHFTVRLRQPLDAHKRRYPDLIYGNIQRLKRSPSAPVTASEDDTAVDAADTILIKSDGTPTYHFANVVDDHLMGITHVIRGSEWMASTPLHYDIYSAFNWTPPQFAHVGLLVDRNKAKLSKRNSDLELDVASMRDKQGILPAPLINFLALLGWSNPVDNDVMELDDLVKNFDLKFTRGNAMVQPEKLTFLQKQHVALQCEKAVKANDASPIRPIVEKIVAEVNQRSSEPYVNRILTSLRPTQDSSLTKYVTDVLLADSKQYKNAAQFVQRNRYFFRFDPSEVPATKHPDPNTSTGLTPAGVHRVVASILQHNWKSEGSTKHDGTLPSYRAITQPIHDAVVTETWRAALDGWDESLPTTPAETEAYADYPSPPREALPRIIKVLRHFSDEQNTGPRTEEIAERLCQDFGLPDSEHEKLTARYKTLHSSLMRFVRERLAYGLPGPNMSVVMAILGKEECRRRLGVAASGE